MVSTYVRIVTSVGLPAIDSRDSVREISGCVKVWDRRLTGIGNILKIHGNASRFATVHLIKVLLDHSLN